MAKFDPSSMPESTSPTVRAHRTFVETSIEDEVDAVLTSHGEDAACLVEDSLRKVTMRIFHKNPKVHSVAKENSYAFDSAISALFGIEGRDFING